VTYPPIEKNHENVPLTAYHVPRLRVNALLDRATRCKLVYVIAGAGYGKTQAVHNYIKQHPDAVVRWLQLTESDNVGARYWEHLTHSISFDNPDLAAKLREFGFPETTARFKQFAKILRNTEHRSHKTFLVLDDFHLIHSRQALEFAERCANLNIPGACVIIISRNEPKLNVVSLISKDGISIITENELRYTQNEIADFFSLNRISFLPGEMPKISNATKGWVLAIKLLSLVLARLPDNIDRALETMKQNVFKLLEAEAFDGLPDNVRKTMVKLSLISDLPLTPLREISNGTSILETASQLSSFIWYDSFINDYRVHPLYMEFLKSKQHLLSEDEKHDTYRWAAQWCCDNNFILDAISNLTKTYQYDRVLDMMLSYPFKLPFDACEYLLGVLEAIDIEDRETENRSILLLKNLFCPLLYMGMGNFEKATEISFATITKWERSDAPIAPYLLYTAYSNLSYIETYTCTVTHKYEFAGYMKKAVEYYASSSVPPVKVAGPFGVADVRAFACLVGIGASLPEFDRFVDSSRETASYIDQTYHKMYAGYADLAAGELAFFKNLLDTARNYALNAALLARATGQHSIEAMAHYYLLRIAVHEGDKLLTKEMLRQLRNHLNNADFWNRQLLYDLFAGSFYAHMGLTEIVPSWLALEDKEISSGIHIPARELIVGVRYHFARGRYKQALAVLCNSTPREPLERFHFGELIISLLFAIARLKTGDAAGAVADFDKAYELSLGGALEMPFIELGNMFKPLAAAASARENSGIPPEWLKSVGRKASVYAKKTAVIMNTIKDEHKITDSIRLSQREKEVLKDLYHGLTRDEIATNQYLSINTVDKVLQSVFIKLDAHNSSDALRIVMDKKLID